MLQKQIFNCYFCFTLRQIKIFIVNCDEHKRAAFSLLWSPNAQLFETTLTSACVDTRITNYYILLVSITIQYEPNLTKALL